MDLLGGSGTVPLFTEGFMNTARSPIGSDQIRRTIRVIRGRRVMLDEDLARIYGVSTTRLNQQVSRNAERSR